MLDTRYEATVWTEPPGQPEYDPFVPVVLDFPTKSLAVRWCLSNGSTFPHATGAAVIYRRNDQLNIYEKVWEVFP